MSDSAATGPEKTVTACLVIIGNEILSGRTRDANLPFLAIELNKLGVRLMECRVIPDVETVIVDTINAVRRRFDYVFTTGGIGPTHDDITADAIAKAFGVGISENAEAVDRLTRYYADPALFTAPRRRMARIPHGASLVDNPVSVAPGFRMENVFTFAGVPMIVEGMFHAMKHVLVGGRPLISRTIRCSQPEGFIAEKLGAVQDRHPDTEIGSYPAFRQGKPSVSLIVRGTDPAKVQAAIDDLFVGLTELSAEPEEIPVT
ncbi:competence/damage-inducible protein A [Vineibacter terrae]|uniref:competence/damage-inducible protein A n=1 Tax=Vineibacter terrae TaxID=2586908 RepID=UPI002E35430F|nr:molybdopterin-binding protein [Vineibacter terrae]HEX2891732.1 molybdopterin-binding protein [Vineibacter terrae]